MGFDGRLRSSDERPTDAGPPNPEEESTRDAQYPRFDPAAEIASSLALGSTREAGRRTGHPGHTRPTLFREMGCIHRWRGRGLGYFSRADALLGSDGRSGSRPALRPGSRLGRSKSWRRTGKGWGRPRELGTQGTAVLFSRKSARLAFLAGFEDRCRRSSPWVSALGRVVREAVLAEIESVESGH